MKAVFKRFWKNSKLPIAKAVHEHICTERMKVEKLEPRILLSADTIGGLDLGTEDNNNFDTIEKTTQNFISDLTQVKGKANNKSHDFQVEQKPAALDLDLLAAYLNATSDSDETNDSDTFIDRQVQPEQKVFLKTITVDTARDYTSSDGDWGDTSDIDSLIANPGADGEISLREAITAANATLNVDGADVINFDLSGSNRISIIDDLPGIDDALIIDGTSDPNFTSSPIITIDGEATHDGFVINASDSTIRGLVLVDFSDDGVDLNGNNNSIVGSYIGLESDGVTKNGSADDGVTVSGQGNTIGGVNVADRNVISGNDGSGIRISGASASNNYVTGNYIGLTADGNSGAGNTVNGIDIEIGANSNFIGVSGAGNVISGNNFGIYIISSATTNNQISANYIGLNAAGDSAVPNLHGIELVGSSRNTTIGGSLAGEGNVISGNTGSGINAHDQIEDTVVVGNIIGLAADGDTQLGNSNDGINVWGGAKNFIIGGNSAAERNIISGNLDNGIHIVGKQSTGVEIYGNYIGTDITGTKARGNAFAGIDIFGSGSVIIGNDSGGGNVISGNKDTGIHIHEEDASDAIIVGNIIGTSPDLTIELGNTNAGIKIETNVDDLVIGGATNAGSNIITNNGLGISIDGIDSNRNDILVNRIYNNSGLGIDLNDDGVTANDLGDADLGANDNANYPTVTSAEVNGTSITISGTLNTNSNRSATLHFYANAIADPSGHGEGEIYIGSYDVVTDGSGNASFETTFNGISFSAGYYITATSTTSAGTSEYSSQYLSTLRRTIVNTNSDIIDGDTTSLDTLRATPGADGLISLAEAITAANNTTNNGAADVIHFDLSGSNIITLTQNLPVITEAIYIDGSSDPNFISSPIVTIDGNENFRGLVLNTNDSTIKALSIVGALDDGLIIVGDDNTIIGNYIGIESDGISVNANSRDGISISGSNNVIGGTELTDRNVIAGNGNAGIYISGSTSNNNAVHNNYLGLDANGAILATPGDIGVLLASGANNNLIGGDTDNKRNIISGHSEFGIHITGIDTDENNIQGNFIGTSVDGESSVGNNVGIQIDLGASDTNIGGANSGEGNLVSGNSFIGILITGSTTLGTEIKGNIIGLDKDGEAALGNSDDGIAIRDGSSNNFIGGLTANERNVISGNGDVGIIFRDSGTSNNTVVGNYIGSDATGEIEFGNRMGIRITNANDNIIGSVGAGNLIVGNQTNGIDIKGANATNNIIVANIIGTNATKNKDLGNTGSGIHIGDSASDTVIGGNAINQANVILHNNYGILIQETSTENSILINEIHQNATLGIELNEDGIDTNDPLDADSGANHRTNFPVITTAMVNGTDLVLRGTLLTQADADSTIRFFVNQNSELDGHGEGEQFIGSTLVTANAQGEVSFNITLTGASIPAGRYITATSTVNNNTSEFSAQTLTENYSNTLPNGEVSISGIAEEGSTLTASHTLTDADGLSGSITFQWRRDGFDIAGETGTDYVLAEEDIGSTITVVASYTDDFGNDEVVESAAAGPVLNVNSLPTGTVTISGTFVQGEMLTASNTIADEDGLSGEINYQWYRDNVEISGATEATYLLSQDDVGANISVTARYTDDQATNETVSSASFGPIGNVNDTPTGDLSIIGSALQGQTLTLVEDIDDLDGVNAMSFQWFRDNEIIDGETSMTYVLTQNDVGSNIHAVATYLDDFDEPSQVVSNTMGPIANANDLPSGSVNLSGTAREGETLTVTNSLGDIDGISGSINYQWYRNGEVIDGANSENYQLTQLDVGATIYVVANYVDDYGTAENMSSNILGPVENSNDTPTGSVTISGVAREGEILTAANTLADVDGISQPIVYQWLRDGTIIAGETNTNYSLTLEDVGALISVRASYTDDGGFAEQVLSNVIGPIDIYNTEPTGNLLINGSPTEGQTLTINDTIDDSDGIASARAYQWLRDGSIIGGATESNYTLTQQDVGTQVTAQLSFTDGKGKDEVITSNALGPIANINDLATGSVAIVGTAVEDQILTIANSLEDEDGISLGFQYQWMRDGLAIGGATEANYQATQTDVGSLITVQVSYTDDFGNGEIFLSDAVGPIENVNDDPVGNLTISGNPSEGSILVAGVNFSDPDGINGNIQLQWYRDNILIAGAQQENYLLTEADVGHIIDVRASYLDDYGNAETVVSLGVGPIQNINDLPVGSVTISGVAEEDQILSANHNLTDEDGISNTVNYQWLRDGAEVVGATNANYQLDDADVGREISVVASYVDDNGTLEQVFSDIVGPVANVNDSPSGAVEIIGALEEGNLLFANISIEDADGIGETIQYEWFRDGSIVDDETSDSYFLSGEDVGSVISLRITYVDAHGTEERIFADPTGVILPAPLDPFFNSEIEVVGPDTSAEEISTEEEINVQEEIINAQTEEVTAEQASSEQQANTNTDGTADSTQGVSAASLALDQNITERSLFDVVAGSALDQNDTNLSLEQISDINTAYLDGSSYSNTEINNAYSIKVQSVAFLESAFDSVATSMMSNLTILKSSGFEQEIEKVKKDLEEDRTLIDVAIVGGSAAFTTGFSVGYVIWTLRSGIIASSVLSALPAWRFVDPLPILRDINHQEDEEDESLESMVSKNNNDEN